MIFADVIWPALLLEGQLLAWWAIGAGLIVEFLVLRFWLRMRFLIAMAADVLMNAVSTIAGIVLIPAVGIAWEIFPGLILYKMLNIGTFNPLTWMGTCVLAALVNTLVEGGVLRLVFKVKFQKKVFWALLLGNTVSVALAMGSLRLSLPQH